MLLPWSQPFNYFLHYYGRLFSSIVLLALIRFTPTINAQENSISIPEAAPTVTWCTVSVAEHRKCIDLQQALIFASAQRTIDIDPILRCALREGKYECMLAISGGEADVTAVEAGDLFTAGRWHGLIPIAVEEYGRGNGVKNAVVVAQAGLAVESLQDLSGKRLCSPGVGSMAGWVIPVMRLLRQSAGDSQPGQTGVLELNITDCNNPVATMSAFFGPSCVPGALDYRHNPRSTNPDQLCRACRPSRDTENSSWCSSSDPYAGTDGVLNCLVHGSGDVAFMSAEAVLKLSPSTAAMFKFVCPDGRTAPVTPLSVCSWGAFPSDAFVTDSAKPSEEKAFLQTFLGNLTRTAARIFSDRLPGTNEKRYNGTDLMWSDATTNLRILSDAEQRLPRLFGPNLYATLHDIPGCPATSLRLCVVGRMELDKCTAFQLALQSRNLKPPLGCVPAPHHWACMSLIAAGHADVMVADPADSYLAEKLYGLQPFMAEIYDQGEPFVFGVAVAKRKDPATSLLDLRGKRTCHGALYGAVGWSVPVSFLLTQNRVRDALDCGDLTYQVAQIFQKACAPGALFTAAGSSTPRSVLHTENLCDLCMGDGEEYCVRGPGEPYFGSTGAFKCLVEGGGHVAFVTHLTARENTDGRNMRTWARALVSQDYELLCVDGTRAPLTEWAACNLGRVPSHVLMTSGRKKAEEVAAYVNLLDYAQELFGGSGGINGSPLGSGSRDFRMFGRDDGPLGQDLIFRDGVTRLAVIALENRTVAAYLGDDFVRVVLRAQCSGSSHATVTLRLSAKLYCLVFCFFVHRLGMR